MENIERRGFFRGVLGILAAPFLSKTLNKNNNEFVVGELNEFISGEIIQTTGWNSNNVEFEPWKVSMSCVSSVTDDKAEEINIDGLAVTDYEVTELGETVKLQSYGLVALTSKDVDNITAETPTTGNLEELLDWKIAPEFPLDILAPGDEKEYVAYTIPNWGRIPDKIIIGEPISEIDWNNIPTLEESCKLRGLEKEYKEFCVGDRDSNDYGRSTNIYWDVKDGEWKEYPDYPTNVKLEWDGVRWVPMIDNPPLSVVEDDDDGVCESNEEQFTFQYIVSQ